MRMVEPSSTDEARPPLTPPPFRVGDMVRSRWGDQGLAVVEGFYRPLTPGQIPPGWWAMVRLVDTGEAHISRISAATHDRVEP
jgi:hypothetical protein